MKRVIYGIRTHNSYRVNSHCFKIAFIVGEVSNSAWLQAIKGLGMGNKYEPCAYDG